MPFAQRVELYRQIEEQRGRPLMAYITSSRPEASGQMAGDVIAEFARQILTVPADEENVDLLVVSRGGDPMAAAHVISMLRERFKTIGILLPFTAFSAATMLALGANEIVMHPLSNLGPVDPQMVASRPVPGDESKQTLVSFGAEDLGNFLDFVRQNVGISDQEQLERAFELLCKDVGALPVGAAKRSSQLSLSLGEKLLSLHMQDVTEARAIAERLSKSFFHHGYPIGRTEAKAIGLPVQLPAPELEILLWQVWRDAEDEMQCCNPFNPLELVFSDPAAAQLIAPVPQVQLPMNLPQQMVQAAYNQILQQIRIVQVDAVSFELFLATVESVRCRSEFRVRGQVNAARMPDMSIKYGATAISQGWTFSENPAIMEEQSSGQITGSEG